MRVFQLISSAGYYGAEAVVLNLAVALRRNGCDVRVGVFFNQHVVNSVPNTEITQRAEDHGLPVQIIPCSGKLDWKAVRTIRMYVQEQAIDVLHLHGYKADVYGYLACRNTSTKLISTCHLWTHGDMALRFYSLVDRIVLRRFPTVVAVSENIAASLRRLGVSSEKIRVIDNGIDTLPFTSAEPSLRSDLLAGSAPIVGLVGRLARQKGPDYFLKAATMVKRHYPDALFVFVGQGPEKEILQAAVKRLSLEENVIFVGRRGDMPGVYTSLDVLVLPSRDEGMPMTIIEALAAGTPVIATRVGSVPELIKDEQTGLLLEPGDIEGLSNAIIRLLADSDLRQRYAQAGQQLVREQYSADAMAAKYLSLYTERLPLALAHERGRLAQS